MIEGLVLDASSRQPLAGVAVESDRLSGYPYSNHRVLKTTTDKDGRFRLIGMPKGSENRLLIVPNNEQPYFMREIDVPDPVGLGPVALEVELHRGIWITGRVTDKATGEGVPAVRLHYLPYRNNEFAQKLPEFDSDGRVQGDQAPLPDRSGRQLPHCWPSRTRDCGGAKHAQGLPRGSWIR